MNSLHGLLILGVSLFSVAAGAAPAQIVIIRHGEKPPVGNELNDQGFQRANLLPGWVAHNSTINAYGSPVAIYAMAPSSANGSVRPIQTVTPLADRLGLSLITSFTKDELGPLTQQILNTTAYDGRTVLICWEHKVIPTMAQGFGLTQGPGNWPGAVFDVAWVLRSTANGSMGLQFIAENLLAGDATSDAAAVREFKE